MSPENVGIVQSGFLAFARGGVDALAEFWHPEINWRAMEGALDDVGEMNGIEAARRYVQDWCDMFDDFTSEIEEVCDVGGDQVVAVIHNAGRAKRSGIPTELHYAALYTIRDGKLVRVREYATRSEALKAVGLAE
ncbi:MAG TPA: nuclear transport factor 2 family protein [Solirubrobacteraceae bacterium]|nr:nuclear transport factor 2 family protein [Solirubrobacteraceae bacterium]